MPIKRKQQTSRRILYVVVITMTCWLRAQSVRSAVFIVVTSLRPQAKRPDGSLDRQQYNSAVGILIR